MARITSYASAPARAGRTEETAGSSAQVREIKDKVGELVTRRFAGDTRAAFDHYGSGGVVNRQGLVKLLSDAGVGNGLTRGFWADGIIEQLDSNGDRAISWDEFQRVAVDG